jgi:hypothetical protein
MIAAERNADWKELSVQRDTELRKKIKSRVERETMEMELREAAGLIMLGEKEKSSDRKESKLDKDRAGHSDLTNA